jgi:hypothetical protein
MQPVPSFISGPDVKLLVASTRWAPPTCNSTNMYAGFRLNSRLVG